MKYLEMCKHLYLRIVRHDSIEKETSILFMVEIVYNFQTLSWFPLDEEAGVQEGPDGTLHPKAFLKPGRLW